MLLCRVQETRDFFANTKVVSAIVPREGGTEDSMTQKFTKGNMFTHHQKSVIVDAQDAKCAPFPCFPFLGCHQAHAHAPGRQLRPPCLHLLNHTKCLAFASAAERLRTARSPSSVVQDAT